MIGPFMDRYDWLSNFYNVAIRYKGFVYPSVENAYQASKCLNKFDYEKIVNMTPAGSKKFVRTIECISNHGDIKLEVMKQLLIQKFNVPFFKEKSIATGNEEIVEVNYWKDTFWGKYNGIGSNHLGKLIMEIRDCLK